MAINADVNALIVARGHRAQRGAAAVLRSLPACSDAAIERALSQVGRAIPGQRPIGLMSPYERAALYQRASAARTMSAWALQQGERERERDLSFEQRQADLRATLSNEPLKFLATARLIGCAPGVPLVRLPRLIKNQPPLPAHPMTGISLAGEATGSDAEPVTSASV